MATLPTGMVPLVANYSSTDPGGVLRTDVAGGPARYRLDYDQGTQHYSVSFAMNAAMFDAWTTFYHVTIKKGALAFDMRLDSGFGTALHSVNIVPGSYSTSRNGGTGYLVSFVVEAISQAYAMSYSDAVALIAFYEVYLKSADALLARIAQFALVDTLVLAP